MDVTEDKAFKVEISIPYNENTEQLVDVIQNFVIDAFSGLTRSVIEPQVYVGFWLDPDVDPPKIWEEPVVRFLIYFNLEEVPEAFTALRMLAEQLIEAGEKETWQISYEAMRYKYLASS
jgi:hypothetical protein